MRSRCASLALTLAALAPAASIDKPVYVEAGAFFPNYRGASFDHDLGGFAGAGYSFYERGDFRLSGEVRGAFHDVTAGGADFAGDGPEDDGLSFGEASIGLRHRHHGTPLFTGLLVGVGRVGIDGGETRTEAAFAAEVGFDLGKRVYVSARYQTSSADALRGATLGLGFRF